MRGVRYNQVFHVLHILFHQYTRGNWKPKSFTAAIKATLKKDAADIDMPMGNGWQPLHTMHRSLGIQTSINLPVLAEERKGN